MTAKTRYNIIILSGNICIAERRECAIYPPCNPVFSQRSAEEHLKAALLRGDRAAVSALLEKCPQATLTEQKNDFLNDLTDRYLAGALPFCQLTAAAQAAGAFPAASVPPVACCGAAAGNTSAAGRDYMLMLLSMWGVPTLDLGVDVSAETFVSAIAGNSLQFAVCVIFTAAQAACVRQIDTLAKERSIRQNFRLVVCGASPSEDGFLKDLPADFAAHRSAEAAQWVMNAWKS